MSRQMRLTLGQATALVLALMLALSAMVGAPLARAQETGEESSVRTLTNAEFRWGINKQSAGPSHEPGRTNFLSAGDLLDASWPIGQQAWDDSDRNVRIEKRDLNGKVTPATWLNVTTDQAGVALTSSSSTKYSGLEAVFENGAGTVDPEAGTAKINWTGTASVLYYSGRTRLTISDPELVVTKTTASVTATLGGLVASRENSATSLMVPRKVVIADLPRSCIDLGGEKGFSVTPEYRGVKYNSTEAPQDSKGSDWGAFPKSFVDFASEAGSGQFWYSTGSDTDDAKKVALPVSIGYSSGISESLSEVCESPNSTGSKGVIGQVIDDTVEDILRAAGTDVSDTAAAWMDEAWKPLQPDAMNAQGGTGTGTGTGTATASVPEPSTTGAGQVDEVFEEYFEEYYTTTSVPMTAGTVGAAVASIPEASSGTSLRGSAGPAPAPAPSSDQSTIPVAANSPLYGSDVVYAQTSASQKAENPTHQWQWWVGAALLALAAVLFYQTVRRKD